jgi:hypothetical protein
MKILVTGRTLARGAGPSARFETARQCQAQVTTGQADLRDARALLAATEVPCLETGGITSGARCLSCTRLVSFFPGPDRRSITVRCLWTDDDRVTTVMVPAARLAALPRDASAADASRVAADYQQDQVLVLDRGVLLGVVRRSILEWADPERRVDQLCRRQSWILGADASLGDAVGVFAVDGAEYILVVDGGALVGMISREQLRVLATPHAP